MEFLSDSLYWIACIVMALAFVVAVGLLFAPAQLRTVARSLDRWHSLRPLLGPLEKPRYTERRFYRHHRLTGVFVVFGAGYILLRLSAISADQAQSLLPAYWTDISRLLVAAAAYWFLIVGSIMAFGVGLLVFFRPSLLKHPEVVANRWLSTRQALKPLDVSRSSVDRAVWHHPRLTGALLLLGIAYIWIIVYAYRGGLL